MPRWLLLLAGGSVVAAIAALTIPFPVNNNDLWIHLKVGEYVLTHGGPPLTDPYSFMAADRPYIAHSWGAAVLFSLAYGVAGVGGLVAVKGILVATTMWLLYQTARGLGARRSVILVGSASLLYIMAMRFSERPHLFSTLGTAGYLWLFVRYRHRGRDPRWLWGFPLAQVIWANLHAGQLQGLLLVGGFALGETAMWARAHYWRMGTEQALPRIDVFRLLLVLVLCVLAACATPYGAGVLWFTLDPTQMRDPTEWWPPYYLACFSLEFYLYMAHIFGLVAAFFAVSRVHRPSQDLHRLLVAALWLVGVGLAASFLFVLVRGPWVTDPTVFLRPTDVGPHLTAAAPAATSAMQWLLWTVLALIVGWTLVHRRRVDVTQAVIIFSFYGLSLQQSRSMADAAMVTFPFLCASASALWRRRPRGPGDDTARVLVGVGLLLAMAVHVSVFTYYYGLRADGGRRKGLGLGANLPTCAVDYVARNQIQGHAFVRSGFAAWVIWKLSPSVLVNMDSRTELYGVDLHYEYLLAKGEPVEMQRYLQRHRVDVFLLGYQDLRPRVLDDLLATGWTFVHFDDFAYVMLPQRPHTDTLIRHDGYQVIRPWENVLVTTDNAPQVLMEATRALEQCPNGATFAWAYKQRALQALGRPQEAFDAALKVPPQLRLTDERE